MQGLDKLTENYIDRAVEKAQGDFPSYLHEVAWMLAEYFNEPYGYWVRMMRKSILNPGQVKHEFEVLRTKDFTKRDKVRMLMSIMKIK